MSELSLRQDVIDELEFEPSVNAAHIGVAVDNDVVTLSGHVATYTEKQAAVAAVRHVKGVRGLADEIEVRYSADKKMSDDQIAKRALDILSWDSVLPKDAIQVTVRDGFVTLAGAVQWQFQRTAAEEDVRKLSGVRSVVNSISLKPHPKVDDIKQKIEAALRRHADVEAKGIRVSVKDGNKVVLEGKVDNWEERRAVENAAWSAFGVSGVEDRLMIL